MQLHGDNSGEPRDLVWFSRIERVPNRDLFAYVAP